MFEIQITDAQLAERLISGEQKVYCHGTLENDGMFVDITTAPLHQIQWMPTTGEQILSPDGDEKRAGLTVTCSAFPGKSEPVCRLLMLAAGRTIRDSAPQATSAEKIQLINTVSALEPGVFAISGGNMLQPNGTVSNDRSTTTLRVHPKSPLTIFNEPANTHFIPLGLNVPTHQTQAKSSTTTRITHKIITHTSYVIRDSTPQLYHATNKLSQN